MITGSITIILAVLAFMILPKDVDHSRYFTPEERNCSSIRLALQNETEESRFNARAILAPLYLWQSWLYAAMALGYGVACASISNFLPVRGARFVRVFRRH